MNLFAPFRLDQAVRQLQGLNPARSLGFTDLLGCEVADSDAADLARLLETLQGSQSIADGRFAVRPVDLINGNALQFQAAETRLDRFRGVTRADVPFDALPKWRNDSGPRLLTGK